MKKILTVLLLALLAAGIVYVSKDGNNLGYATTMKESAVAQQMLGIDTEANEIVKVYHNDVFVGVLYDQTLIDQMLKDVYNKEFKDIYPNRKIALSSDIKLVREYSYEKYENVDSEIIYYLRSLNKYAINATAIEFANDEGIYAQIYVDDEKKYEEALTNYLSLFVNKESIYPLMKHQDTAELTTYGTRDVSIKIMQNITKSEVYVDVDEVMTSVDAIQQYLEYGDNRDRLYYTVKSFDSVAAVARIAGLLPEQIVNINRDILSSEDQVLEVGTKLNITYFSPIFDVIVEKQSLEKEVVYPTEPIYILDETIAKGKSETKQAAIPGSKNVLYKETWINGVLVSGEELSSIVTVSPVQEIIKVGVLQLPGVGTGTFRPPVDNAKLTCGWYCYPGHQAADLINRYSRYGQVKAADRGVVLEIGYDSRGGNWIRLDHNNGYVTYYGHMNQPSPLHVGDIVDKGDVLGQIGMTGLASGPHVHFSIEENGKRVNPCAGYIDCN